MEGGNDGFEPSEMLLSNIAVHNNDSTRISENSFVPFEEQFSNIIVQTSEDSFESFEEQFSNTVVYRTSENGFESFEEQVSNSAAQFQIISRNDSIRTVDAPKVGQTFGSWDELDRFISFYTKLHNFVSIIHGSEYSNGICRNR
ncbi:hypothetical protein F8M41_011720 [Gigaspora margarita]|uniref:Uncharacterized protein n=1 Tax=Gigaspora margarita TaxID=4874 RepID=A0A8H3WZ04_GIGMA|nr:hypothetical protein F8M41_011720 [Gigaspora margarita]